MNFENLPRTSLDEMLADTLSAIERLKQNPESAGRDAAIKMLTEEVERLRSAIHGLVLRG